MTVQQHQSWMEEMIESLHASAQKYDLLAEAAQNLDSKIHFEKRADEFRYQAQCYRDCLDALRQFAGHILAFDPLQDVS